QGPRASAPTLPAAVDDALYARAFRTDTPFTHWWRKERPQVNHGYLFVLKVNPHLVTPRQTAEPVLYVGAQTAERLNTGNEQGHIVVIVPGDVDLATAKFWFGSRELPERIDLAEIQRQIALADQAGISSPSAAAMAAAVAAGGQPLVVSDRAKLLETAAELIVQESPTETDVAQQLLPVSGAGA
ncbi:MAG TPA: hypothetical protein P5081_12300, partial [Phycisphaerae bacterium]|nr:hypothetical protein [Phycisphaerae bacterium]